MMKCILAALLVLALTTTVFAQGFGRPASQGPALQTRDLPLRLIVLKYADAADLALLFGGSIIQGGGMYGGGSGYGGSSGYGQSSGYGGYGGGGGRSNRGGNYR